MLFLLAPRSCGTAIIIFPSDVLVNSISLLYGDDLFFI